MTSNSNKTGSATGSLPMLAEYRETQARVRELVEKRRAFERRLHLVEESILTKEASYLESTPNGNIITGFDNYMKGTTGAAAQRRKSGPVEQNRVFTKSSISYRPVTGDSNSSTPTSYAAAPPTGSSRDNAASSTAAAAGTKSKSRKRSLATANLGDKDGEGGENDRSTGKKRTNFGASRKQS
ncbi:hypothetical protein E4U22_006237 [Claviceps purpurea]|uniref:Chromatin modification-related protein EAF6 n=2 Tax=Claviceps TaxID=5110 RepID=M1VZW4_CLAP2|nr:hypothetical protein E4U38_004330 [Claviceps purpurea]KAG6295739.1 hypothetical protein E4U09_002023 [Claviceps aff. purpurea]CCE35343.1 uncharacterized protein CPUR_03331 [Claviceps purpurea 20.1]KAG6132087.1 hypothetical protein E4U12_003359 [Claviceps purpurea]KAG6148733.1 hypothetical protein E4U28_003381 [Claviceps purpurea]